MGELTVNGRGYLINDKLEPHVVDSIIEGILKHYPQDAVVEYETLW